MKCSEIINHCKNRLPYNNCRLGACAYTFNTLSGAKIFNFSKYSRENIPKPKPKYKVGDTVILKTEREIVRVGHDCDGTPLYELDNIGFGWSERDFKLANPNTRKERR